MATSTALLKRLEQRLALIERYVIRLADDAGIDVSESDLSRNLPAAPSRHELKYPSGPSKSEGFDATDSARELASEAGLDLSSVQGTGADGRITKGDVEKALQE
jgi:pyruvate dehydrogenase E2 component (dihydrolipoamide acetyltransferase)